ncbi:MAG: hypothetical protein JWP85_168 [Rhodoglobus sp.]|nr:hypothetical protein [Rhodoglobus sp.]
MATTNDNIPDRDRVVSTDGVPVERTTGTDRVVGDRVVDDRIVDDDRLVTDDRVISRDANDVVDRERERFGGFKFGSAFFGWLTATGTGVLLTALVAALGAAIGLGNGVTADDAADIAEGNADTIGIIGAVALLVVLFIAYFAGGYVAGRMARFSGAKQGFAVWLWAVLIAVVVAIVTAVAGDRFDVLAELNSFPRIPLSEGDLTVVGIVTTVLVALVSLGGAILGGLAGMRYHRRVDAVGLGT